jgi:hypothetical protein
MIKNRKLLIALFLLEACVTPPDNTGEKLPASTETSVNSVNPAILPQDGLDTPAFVNLPIEAKRYLKNLSEAFRKKDREFLISQGEAQYEKELRPVLDEGSYLALLYRAGSQDSEWDSTVPLKLDISAIKSIEYTKWEEYGPMLEISGVFHLENSKPLPCRIMLVWRLLEPKILGEWP